MIIKTQLKTPLKCFCLAWLLGCAGPALAVDGVIEINQASALAGGVTSGDTPGFPVTIDQPGSYRLTGNLNVDSADTTAIQVLASRVTIDLNGFSLIGVTVCDFLNPPCTNTGSGMGIKANVSESADVTVKNGTVMGMGSTGVDLYDGGRIENVTARSNGWLGLKTSSGIIRDSVSLENGSIGISGSYNLLVNLVVRHNMGNGIDSGHAGYVIDCNVTGNLGYGLDLASTASLYPGSYKGSIMQGNNGGNVPADQVNGGVQLGENLCGKSPCP